LTYNFIYDILVLVKGKQNPLKNKIKKMLKKY
jgi:hypothetical protein